MATDASSLRELVQNVETARFVRQLVGGHDKQAFHLACAGDECRIGRWGDEDFLVVPEPWASSIRLHGVLQTDELVATVTEADTRQLLLIGPNSVLPSRGTPLDPGEDVVVAGNHVLRLRVDGVLRQHVEDGERHVLLPDQVNTASADATGRTILLITAPRPTADALLWCQGDSPPARLVTGTVQLRPVRGEVCASGCHAAVVVRRPRDRQVWLYDLRSGIRTTVIERRSDLLVWDSDCRLVTVDDQWPHARFWRTASAGTSRPLGHATGAVTHLTSSARGVLVHTSGPHQPPTVKALSASYTSQPAQLPATADHVTTRHGQLRVLARVSSSQTRSREVILLHGGPHGVWTPCWDPIIDLLCRAGLRTRQLEAPYTAALLGRHTPIRPGGFGVLDAQSVADAIADVNDDFRPAPLVIGHSYGGFLAARACGMLTDSIGGLLLMSAVWRSCDLADLRDRPVSSQSPLSTFLRQAFPAESPIPHAELPTSVPVHVIHGAQDTVVPVEIITTAVTAAPHARLTVLPDEGHIPRRSSAVAVVLKEIHAWIRKVEDLANKR